MLNSFKCFFLSLKSCVCVGVGFWEKDFAVVSEILPTAKCFYKLGNYDHTRERERKREGTCIQSAASNQNSKFTGNEIIR